MNKINSVDNTADQVNLGLAYTPKDTDDTVTVTWVLQTRQWRQLTVKALLQELKRERLR